MHMATTNPAIKKMPSCRVLLFMLSPFSTIRMTGISGSKHVPGCASPHPTAGLNRPSGFSELPCHLAGAPRPRDVGATIYVAATQEARRVGKVCVSLDLGGGRIFKKNNKI